MPKIFLLFFLLISNSLQAPITDETNLDIDISSSATNLKLKFW